MLDMISVVVLIVCTLNFAYLDWWARNQEFKCLYCADKDVPEATPAAHVVSYLVLLLWFVETLAWQFWGITDNPYRQGHSAWIRAGDDAAILVLGLVAFCIASAFYFFFKLGRISGIVGRRNEEILCKQQEEHRTEFLKKLRDEKNIITP